MSALGISLVAQGAAAVCFVLQCRHHARGVKRQAFDALDNFTIIIIALVVLPNLALSIFHPIWAD